MLRALGLAVLVAGCGASPRLLGEKIDRQGVISDRVATLRAEARAEWERRGDETALRAAIDRWREVIELRDDDREAYLMLARAHFFLGDGYLVFDPRRKDELAAAFETGIAYADRGLRALSPAFERRRRDGKDVEDSLEGLPPEAVPYLYWYANNLLRWAHVRGTFTIMGEYKRAHRLMSVVEKLDPGYFYGGADRYFGAFLCGAPGIAGGDLEDGKKRLDASLRRAPDFFETRILVAELYAVKTHDRALYESTLRYVLDTPLERLPEAAPENERARKKARNLLEMTERRFK